MGFKMQNIWQRKDVEFETVRKLNEAYNLINFPPFTIKTDAGMTARYLAIYGEDELENLKVNNMVQSTEEKYVKGGTFVPPAPKVDKVPGPGEMAVGTPAGTLIIPKQPRMITAMTVEELESMMDKSTLRCLRSVMPELFNQ